MRFAMCALSAVLLSGCSWLGIGGSSYAGADCAYGGQYGHYSQYGGTYGAPGYGAGAGCGFGQGFGGANGGFGQAGFNGGFGQGGFNGGFGQGGAGGFAGAGGGIAGVGAGGPGVVSGASAGAGAGGFGPGAAGAFAGAGAGGFGPAGFGPGGAGAFAGAGAGGFGPAGFGPVGFGPGGAGGFGPVGFAPVGFIPGGFGNAGFVGGGFGAFGGGFGLRGVSLPFGLEVDIGKSFDVGGNIATAKPAGPSGAFNVSATPDISYKDAYERGESYGLGLTYDVNANTTLVGRVGYSEAEGKRIETGTIDDGITTEPLYAQFSDLEQLTVEAGVRQYMGGWNRRFTGIRPYTAASAGFTHHSEISLSQDSATHMPAGSNVQTYSYAGWTPTLSGAIGAEMQIGPRTAIGVEAGLRWQDNLEAISETTDRWSVPVKLRGRVSF